MTPDKYTIAEKTLDVGDGHTIYSQLWGNPDAEQTILFLHGGPGSGCKNGHKDMFDGTKQRVLFHDQRGSGNSTPAGSLTANTTDHLIADIVKVADAHAQKSFVVTGGSWGSTLALVLAIRQPELVDALVLRGIFTGRKEEIDYLDKGGIKTFFPDVWDHYVASVPKEHQENPGGYHGPRILGDNPVAAKESAFAYDALESGVAALDDRTPTPEFETYDKNGITVEYSYLANNCYLDEGYIIENADKIKCPLYLVQGRYDAVCPPFTAYDLHKAVPDSQLHWTVAGHSGGDRANWQATKLLLQTLTTLVAD